MTTRELARKLGFLEIIKVDKIVTNKYNVQPFNYLLLLDFESTCWNKDDDYKGYPEIIEFPVILYDIKNNKIVEEFQQYVMPTERPKLSKFCTEFTGISQNQVDNGVPLGTCIMLFMNWLKKQIRNYNLILPNNHINNGNICVFATWSDWDLNVCLKNECKRKRLNKPEIFNTWIDIKALYKQHYSRKPKGLNGALSELGFTFIGREHCGLHDARNTAFLTGKMVSDGILLRITSDNN